MSSSCCSIAPASLHVNKEDAFKGIWNRWRACLVCTIVSEVSDVKPNQQQERRLPSSSCKSRQPQYGLLQTYTYTERSGTCTAAEYSRTINSASPAATFAESAGAITLT
jgi:hypothetical protein